MDMATALAELGVTADRGGDSTRQRLDRDGYAPLPGVLSPRQIASFRSLTAALLALEGERAGEEVHQEAGTDRLADLVNKDAAFDVCFTDPRLLACVAHVLGDFKLSSLNFRAALPGRGLQALHTEGGPVTDPADFQVCNSIWLLDDFTAGNGATRVVPGSHRSGKSPRDVMTDTRAAHPDEVLLLAPAGTVVVFNSHLWHGGTQNRSSLPRRAMHSYFTRRGNPQQTDQRKHVRPETLERLSPAARFILDVLVPPGGVERVRRRSRQGGDSPMLLEQFYLESIGHASYLVGDEETGVALVFDPRRDVGEYTRYARGHGLHIGYAADSHGHNDYLSGLTELAARVPGLRVLGSGHGDLGYDHRPVRDGETIEIGDVGIEVLHTPGHTPEHISLLVYDRSLSADIPAMLLSGGALLVGDLGRPDLLGGPEQATAAARTLCETVREKLLPLPDHVQVFPTHVAGSLCSASIGSRLSTTVGYERRANPLLATADRQDEFARSCVELGNLPAVPPYWRRMREQNLAGVAPLGVLPEPAALTPERLDDRRQAGAIVLDARSPEAFAGGHIPGALNVALGPMFATWAGTVLPAGSAVLLVLDDPAGLWEATWQLLRVGYPPPAGWLARGMRGWEAAGLPLQTLPQVPVGELKQRLDAGQVRLLDVRQPAEWAEGHVPGAIFVTGAELPGRLADVPDDGPLAVTCSTGYRSSVAASLLASAGHRGVANVPGGMTAWKHSGYPLTDS